MKAYDRLPRFILGFNRRLRPYIPRFERFCVRKIARRRTWIRLDEKATRLYWFMLFRRNWDRRRLLLAHLSRTAHEKVRPK